jgi:ferritin-like metal-binding protein YciE
MARSKDSTSHAAASAQGTRSSGRKAKHEGRRARRGGNGRSNGHEIDDLEAGFLDELGDMLHAERQLVKALPKLARAAQSRQLRGLFEQHLEETEEQVQRLEQVFELFDCGPKARVCEGMQGILAEGKEMLEKTSSGPARDALLIAAAQKAEHYEIASYGSLCAWAEELGNRQALELLEDTLHEEKAADRKLTRIAESRLNPEASRRGHASGRRLGHDGDQEDYRAGREPGRMEGYYREEYSRLRGRDDRGYEDYPGERGRVLRPYVEERDYEHSQR